MLLTERVLMQLLKNGRKLSLIFEYRHFFNNCRKKILAVKGKEINNKLVCRDLKIQMWKNMIYQQIHGLQNFFPLLEKLHTSNFLNKFSKKFRKVK